MKKNNFFIIFFCLLTLTFGCATKQMVVLPNPDSEKEKPLYTCYHHGIFPGPDNVGDVAQAQLTLAIAEQVRKSNAASIVGSYIGVIINQDPRKSVYIYHPSRNEIRKIKPGDYSLFVVSEIPDYISVRFSGEKSNQRMRIWKKSKVYNGIKIDFGARIES